MRTKQLKNISRILAGIALVTLTTNLFGQLFNQERLLCMHPVEDTSYAKLFFADNAKDDRAVIPANEGGFREDVLYLEHWMTIPFEKGIAEENLQVESWMNVPFEVDEKIEIEDWMTVSWI